MNDTFDLRPLEIFSIISLSDRPEEARRLLTQLRGRLTEPPEAVAAYLRAGAYIFPIMEYTYDLIGNKFSVAGGSSILTDGEFFWRADTAEYVEYYKVALPEEFMRRRGAEGWRPQVFTETQIMDVYRQIEALYKAGLQRDLWANAEKPSDLEDG
jgi:hypothetical protein